jgi:methylenetetrahydrofolate reductase (NADPH)
MVRSAVHLDAALERMDSAGIRDVFVIGGDARVPLGPYRSGLDLLPDLLAHPKAPRSVGIPGYPEGHPLLGADVLREALARKADHADYIVTQICFEPEAIRSWITRTRDAGVDLPVYVGVPGAVDRRRLLEVSAKVGVGASISYLRKQNGIRRLLTHPLHATERIATQLLADGERLGVTGLHFFTFNRLVETRRFVDDRLSEREANRAEVVPA